MKRNITFIHIPKCGGTSIGAMDLCGRVHYFGHDTRNKNFQYFKDSDQRKLSEFSFTFVRNPWDRLVSAYEYLKAGKSNYGDQKDFLHFFSHFKSFEDLILNWDDIFFDQIHFKQQYKWICDDHGKLLPDFIGKIENFQKDFSQVCDMINIPHQTVLNKNTINHSHYRTYYNKITQKIIAEKYKEDIDKFKYTF